MRTNPWSFVAYIPAIGSQASPCGSCPSTVYQNSSTESKFENIFIRFLGNLLKERTACRALTLTLCSTLARSAWKWAAERAERPTAACAAAVTLKEDLMFVSSPLRIRRDRNLSGRSAESHIFLAASMDRELAISVSMNAGILSFGLKFMFRSSAWR